MPKDDLRSYIDLGLPALLFPEGTGGGEGCSMRRFGG